MQNPNSVCTQTIMGSPPGVVAWAPVRQESFALIGATSEWPAARGARAPRCDLQPELAYFRDSLGRTKRQHRTCEFYVKALRATAKAAARIRRRPVGILELVTDVELAAAAASDLVPLAGSGRLGKGVLQARRLAVRSFIRVCHELLPGDPDPLLRSFEDALTRAADPVGRSHRLIDSEPRQALPSPLMSAVSEVIAASAADKTGFLGQRDAAFLGTIVSFGLRLSEAIEMRTDDFERLPGGLWVRVRQKSRRERARVRVSGELESLLESYMSAFQCEMRRQGRPHTLTFGDDGPLWRGRWGKPWRAAGAAARVRVLFERRGLPVFGPQAIRRGVHRELIDLIGRRATAEAMRRRGVATMDLYYGPPAGSTEWRQPPAAAVPVGAEA